MWNKTNELLKKFFSKKNIPIFILILVIFLNFGAFNLFKLGFHSDDWGAMEKYTNIYTSETGFDLIKLIKSDDFANNAFVGQFFHLSNYLIGKKIAGDENIVGISALPFQLSILIITCFLAILLYYFFYILTKDKYISFFLSLFVVFWPSKNGSIFWFGSLSAYLEVMFIVISLFFSVRYFISNKYYQYFISIFAYILANFSYQFSMFLSPLFVVFPIYRWFYDRTKKNFYNILLTVPFFIITILKYYFRMSIAPTKKEITSFNFIDRFIDGFHMNIGNEFFEEAYGYIANLDKTVLIYFSILIIILLTAFFIWKYSKNFNVNKSILNRIVFITVFIFVSIVLFKDSLKLYNQIYKVHYSIFIVFLLSLVIYYLYLLRKNKKKKLKYLILYAYGIIMFLCSILPISFSNYSIRSFGNIGRLNTFISFGLVLIFIYPFLLYLRKFKYCRYLIIILVVFTSLTNIAASYNYSQVNKKQLQILNFAKENKDFFYQFPDNKNLLIANEYTKLGYLGVLDTKWGIRGAFRLALDDPKIDTGLVYSDVEFKEDEFYVGDFKYKTYKGIWADPVRKIIVPFNNKEELEHLFSMYGIEVKK